MHRMILWLLLMAGALCGCSTTNIVWDKPGGSQEEFNRDRYECVQQTMVGWSGGGTGGLGVAMIISAKSQAEKQSAELFKMCMESRGYSGHEVDEEYIKKQREQEERERNKLAEQFKKEESAVKRMKETNETRSQKKAEEWRKFEKSVSVLTINNSDVLVDPESKLMWPKSGSGTTMDWQQGASWASNFSYAGFTDWRLPTKDELKRAYFFTDQFIDVTKSYYWTSSLGNEDNYAIFVSMASGNSNNIAKDNSTVYVLPVRDVK